MCILYVQMQYYGDCVFAKNMIDNLEEMKINVVLLRLPHVTIMII